MYTHISQFVQLSTNEQKRAIARAILSAKTESHSILWNRIGIYADNANISFSQAVNAVKAECAYLIDRDYFS